MQFGGGMMASVHLNRNFMNHPLARDPRTSATWQRSKKTSRWFCKLDDNLSFWLPPGAEHRLPDGLDTNVLFLLLATAKMQKTQRISFSSISEIIKAIGLSYDAYNVGRVRRSLELWSCLSICVKHWHHVGRKEPEKKSLSPPIQSLKLDRPIEITISKDWHTACAAYFVSVPLPLPTKAPAQNLVLLAKTSAEDHRHFTHGVSMMHARSVRGLCNAIGIAGSHRRRRLAHTFDAAATWFKKHGLDFEPLSVDSGGYRLEPGTAGAINYTRFYLVKKIVEPPQAEPIPTPQRQRQRKRIRLVQDHDYGFSDRGAD
jgi:hypothetical protein